MAAGVTEVIVEKEQENSSKKDKDNGDDEDSNDGSRGDDKGPIVYK